MDVYRTDRIRNVVLLGHGGSGKTTLVEAMAYLSGITNRLGKVADGNTISDFDKEEIKRKFSISAPIVPIEWGKVKINVLDTPGLFDFVGEAEEADKVHSAASCYFRATLRMRSEHLHHKAATDIQPLFRRFSFQLNSSLTFAPLLLCHNTH